MFSSICEAVQHRPWPLPQHRWRYYQEWNRALFLHWHISPEALRPLVPGRLDLDILEGQAWVSVVAFTMEQIRPRYFPAFGPVSNFHELNVRTYVTHGGKAGVYFLSIEAQKAVSAYLARRISGLPYMRSVMRRDELAPVAAFHSANTAKGFGLDAWFRKGPDIRQKTPADLWLTERYCLYQDIGSRLYRYDIHHLPWPLQEVALERLELHYQVGGLDISERAPDLVHYALGVKVLAWGKARI